MKHNKQSLVAAWMRRSEQDLEAAVVLLEHEQAGEIVLFHLQQSVEKAIKAYLIDQEKNMPHVHDIELLLDEASNLDQRFKVWESLENMTVFAVVGRYPESDDWIGDCDPRPWIDEVTRFCQFVRSCLEGL